MLTAKIQKVAFVMQVPQGSMLRAEAPALRPRLCPHYQWQSPTQFATTDTADLGLQNSATCQDGTSITNGVLMQRY